MPPQAASDASFYALVHFVLEGKRADVVEERRASERREFTSLQFIAPYRDGRLPTADEFQQVLCKDLSPGGVSFLTDEIPSADYVVVALGGNPPIFLSGAITYRWPKALAGEELILVGVRFISRIKTNISGPLVPNAPAYAAAILGEE